VNILIIGNAGREHALEWKLSQSPHVEKIFTSPGNAGTQNNLSYTEYQIKELADFASKNNCFTVVGPLEPLARGIVDKFNKKGLKIVGPTKNAAQLESSKAWAKDFMRRHGIPTTSYIAYADAQTAKDYVKRITFRVVVKVDGNTPSLSDLSCEKVTVCDNKDEAISVIDKILVQKKFGNPGKKIVIEERIDGYELSVTAIMDGKTAVMMTTDEDHKRIYDSDLGPNTGGIGNICPSPYADKTILEKIQKKILGVIIDSMSQEGIPFKGFLFINIMIKNGEPYVLEINTRLGNPDATSILMLMESDLYDYLVASVDETLSSMPPISWKKQNAACVVLCSKGYPGSHTTGEEIYGLDSATENSNIFHMETKKEKGSILTDGGRVLAVTALGDSLESAIKNAYALSGKISWPSKYYRKDIGKKGLNHQIIIKNN